MAEHRRPGPGAGEYFRHYLFGSSEPEDTDAYLLLRFRLNADLHVTPYFRMFAECKRALSLDRDLAGAGRRRTWTNWTSSMASRTS